MLEDVTAVVLAGGKGRRMGGVDKGLMDLNGKPVIEYVISAAQPQIARLIISANRNLARYNQYGFTVVADRADDYLGPLAGIASALQVTDTPYLLSIPCDAPLIRDNLAERLHAVLQTENTALAVAHDGDRMQPVFMLLRRELLPRLLAYLDAGGRRVDAWCEQHDPVLVDFSASPEMFLNMNTSAEQSALAKKLGQNGA